MRKYNRKRTNIRKVGTTSKPESTKELTKDIVRIKRKVDKMAREDPLPIEKFISTSAVLADEDFNNVGTPLSGTDGYVNSVAWGGVQNGVLVQKYLKLRGHIYSQVDPNPITMRVIIIRDKQPQATALVPYTSIAPTYANLMWENPNRGTINVFATYVQSKPRRFDVLYDRFFTAAPRATGSAVTPSVFSIPFNVHINLRGRKTQLLANATSGAFEETESYYLFFVSSYIASTPPTLVYNAEFAFTS